MKHLFSLLLVLLAYFCVGCSTSHLGADEQGARPADFSVTYEWREGSLPPPYHYEYVIGVKPTGEGEVVLTPDYPAAAVPKWVENFKPEAQGLDDLYRVMVENGLFTTKWRLLERPPVGGSNQTMVVTARGEQVTVKDYLVSEQEAPAKAMYSAVRALVPREVWERLQAKRKQYMQEHPRR